MFDMHHNMEKSNNPMDYFYNKMKKSADYLVDSCLGNEDNKEFYLKIKVDLKNV